MTNSLVQVLCNASLQHYGGDLYVGVMTVINSIREVVSMPVQGITNGCQPVLGYNYGAGVRAGAPGDPVHHGAYGGLLRGGVGAGYGRARAAHPYL